MPSLRQICSDVENELNATNLDDRLSYRFIISKLKDSASVFLKQDAEYRKLFKISSLWRTINCFELKEVSLEDCGCDVDSCDTIRKSLKRLPRVYSSTYGYILKATNLNGTKEYKEIRPNEYRNYKNRPYKSKRFGYFWIDDGYIYVPDSNIESIKVAGMFEDTTKIDTLNSDDSSSCISPLDGEFNFPKYIIKLAKDEITKEFAMITERITPDEKADLNKINKN